MSSPPIDGDSPLAGFGTAAIALGDEPSLWGANQIVPPISCSITYKKQELDHHGGHYYSRVSNPTRDVVQKRLAALEDGKYCRLFSSGLATAMCITEYLFTGDHIVCCDDVYGGVSNYLSSIAVTKHGLQCSYVDMTQLAELEKALQPNTRLVWLETPSNPLLKIVDIQAVARIVKAFNRDILVVVDNTFLSPYFQRPLALGADAAMHSITKYINGHSDVLMGGVVTNDAKLDAHLAFMQEAVGAVPSPYDLFLANRGIKTLHLRMQMHQSNGLAVAKWLSTNPRVTKVNHPALPSHPQHELHKRQSKGSSGMLSFTIRGGLQEAKTLLTSLKIFTLATSLGGYESLAELPLLMSTNQGVAPHAVSTTVRAKRTDVTDNLIRLSVGLEDVADLVKDLQQALEKAVPSV